MMSTQGYKTGVISSLFLLACTPIDTPPIVDAQGNVVRVPAAYDSWLEIEELTPSGGEIGSRPVFVLTFNAYVSTRNWLDYDVMHLSSGGIRASGRATWDVVGRTIEWRPFGELIDGLDYRVGLNPSRLESVTGAPPFVGTLPVFRVNSEIENVPPALVAASSWGDVQGIIERTCASCHRDPEWLLNPLTVDSMIGVKAEALDVFLVKPFDAANSYLMHKILPDYPNRRFGVQPPTWSDEDPLSSDEIRAIASWIDSGARR